MYIAGTLASTASSAYGLEWCVLFNWHSYFLSYNTCKNSRLLQTKLKLRDLTVFNKISLFYIYVTVICSELSDTRICMFMLLAYGFLLLCFSLNNTCPVRWCTSFHFVSV
jgi:hypothetical protein